MAHIKARGSLKGKQGPLVSAARSLGRKRPSHAVTRSRFVAADAAFVKIFIRQNAA
jgi:hypothetical protein